MSLDIRLELDLESAFTYRDLRQFVDLTQHMTESSAVWVEHDENTGNAITLVAYLAEVPSALGEVR